MRHEGLYLPEGKGVKAQGCKGSIAGKENILRWDPLPGGVRGGLVTDWNNDI